MMTKSEQNLADLEFIINELHKQSSWSFSEFKQHWAEHPEDRYDNIPLKDGSHIPANAAVGARFNALASRNSESDQERHSYDLGSFVSHIKKQFVHYFIELRRPLDQRTSDKLVGNALSSLKKERVEITHFIPCEIVLQRQPTQFQIGSVIFHSTESFSGQILPTIRSRFEDRRKGIQIIWSENEKIGKQPVIPGQTLEDVIEAQQRLETEFCNVFQELGWVAEIKVPPCLPDISFSRAKETVNAALDVLKLFLGDEKGKKFRIVYDKGISPRAANLSRDNEGEFHTGWTISGSGALIQENWFDDLKKQLPIELQIAGISVSHLLDPKPTTPLSDKWLGALLWYGQGVSEDNYAAKIVKYVAALEQLTISKKGSDQDIAKTVTERTRFLCGEILEEDKTGNTQKVIKNMYKYRCDLIHGQISPSSPKIHDAAMLSGRITQQALFSALRLFVYLSTEKEDSLKELENEYSLRLHNS